jgi:hypothetical protein
MVSVVEHVPISVFARIEWVLVDAVRDGIVIGVGVR